jgi:type IV pilus assembly protein PilC
VDFRYKARNAEGKIVKGQHSGQSQYQVVQWLREQNLVPISVTENRKGTRLPILDRIRLHLGVSLKDKAVLFRQMATLLGAGVVLGNALSVVSDQTKNVRLAHSMREVKRLVDSGNSLSSALRSRKEFSSLICSIIEAGEDGGMLDRSLERVAYFLERQEELRKKIISAVTYPAAVSLFALLVLWILITVIVPKFAMAFRSLNVELPKVTTITFRFAIWLNERWYVFIGGVLVFVLVIILLNRYRKTKPMMDALKLKLPLIGDIFYKSIMARSLRTLSSLLEAGIPVLNALEMAAGVANNAPVEKAFMGLRDAARKGRGLGETAKTMPIFPLMVAQMIVVGEETGKVDAMLNKVADWFESELDEKIKRLTSILEPALIIAVGLVVAMIASAIYLPIVGAIQALI